MAHQQQGRVLPLRNTGQGRSALTHLGDRARGATELTIVEGLNAVDHRHRRSQGFQLLQHQLQIGFGQQLQARATSFWRWELLLLLCQPPPAQLHLLSRFLGTHVEHRMARCHGLSALQQQGAFADAGVTAQEPGTRPPPSTRSSSP